MQIDKVPFQMFGHFQDRYGSPGSAAQVQNDTKENMEKRNKICDQTTEHERLPENPQAK